MKKCVSIIGTAGIPARYGGFETLADRLVYELNHEFDITVFCSKKLSIDKLKYYNGASLRYLNLNANGVQSILYDILSIAYAIRISDTILILGVSGCIVLPLIKMLTDKKIIVNIDGIEWKRNKWNKFAKLFLRFSERIAVKYSDIVISDNEAIKMHIKNSYNKESVFIAYGGDHVKRINITLGFKDKFPFLDAKYALSVCRIEPENNVHLILNAMVNQDEMSFVFVGNWDSSIYGREIKNKYIDIDHIYLIDPIYDQDQLNIIRSNCKVYIHGHSAGGTNPSLVEAMHLHLPIIAYKVDYNIKTTQGQALYFSDELGLLDLINHLDEKELSQIGKYMYDISCSKYKWKIVSEQYARLL